MTRTNHFIEVLKDHPCVYTELPYKPGINSMSTESRQSIRRIRVSGRKGTHAAPYGHMQTVYYLDGDEDRAVELFVKVNVDMLKMLDLRRYTILDSGLPKEIARLVKDVMKAHHIH
jgi:hypothetical protein